MTRTSEAETAAAQLGAAHGARLHRLAAMLTGDPQTATELTARTLRSGAGSGRPGAPPSLERLESELVRRYLRSAPRRAESLPTPGGDAGDVLRGLRPRARAASALRLVERWSTDDTAAAVGVRPRRVGALVPQVPGLDLALTGLADRHALTGPELREALLEAVDGGPVAPAPRPHRRWARTAAAVLPVALLVGYAVLGDRDEGGARADDPSVVATADLTGAGWRLEDGSPPRTAMGLHLRETVTVGAGRSGTVDLPVAGSLGFAAFGVLWCDMPPAQDDHLRVPAGTLTVGDTQVHLPCAGRDGAPPVSQVAALPTGRTAVLRVSGDIPGDGAATLAVYTEMDNVSTPVSRGKGRTDAPPVGNGELALDLTTSTPTYLSARRTVQALSIGSGSTVRVWAGRTGAVTVNVDGVPATDDGDVAALTAAFDQWSAAQLPGDGSSAPGPQPHADWSTQQADVRDGRWSVHVPGMSRTFALPPRAVPPPGERRTVVVEVITENIDDQLQVAVTDAEPVEVDTSPLTAVPDPVAPELVLGHRLVGQWQVPSDGHLRELRVAGAAALPEAVVVLAVRPGAAEAWFPSWGEGAVTRGAAVVPLWLQQDVATAVDQLRQPWFDPLAGHGEPVLVATPVAPGQPPTTVLAYEPVAYEDYDFAAAVPPPELPAGASAFVADLSSGFTRQAEIGPGDLEEGRVTVPVTDGTVVAARVTTEGRGRIRFLVNGLPADPFWHTDGWWSSWTAERATSEIDIAFPAVPRRDTELTLVVEDYEDFSVEVLTG